MICKQGDETGRIQNETKVAALAGRSEGKELLIFWGYFEVRASRFTDASDMSCGRAVKGESMRCGRMGQRRLGKGIRTLLLDRSDVYIRCLQKL